MLRVENKDAFYVTCPCHKSIRDDGTLKERKCKKEMSVSNRHSSEDIVRMMAWWVVQGFFTVHYALLMLMQMQNSCYKVN